MNKEICIVAARRTPQGRLAGALVKYSAVDLALAAGKAAMTDIDPAKIDSVILGNVNVSKFGTKLAGVGGFVNITQTARRLVFCGTFTAGGLKVAVAAGKLRIVKEGSVRKFVKNVEQVSFSAARSRQVGQQVLYVTERAVFRLVVDGLELIELAPGIDLEKQVLAQMDFRPIIGNVRPMPPRVFTKGTKS